jgi:DNA ligase-1
VTFAKAKSGLTDEELKELTTFVKKNTKEKFGPVRSVTAEHVFQIAFDGIVESKRHKCGVLLKNPRISQWLKDKKIEEANSLEDLKKML